MSRFLQCKECHGICLVLFGKEDAGCGTYEKLHANTSDGAVEKHLPVVKAWKNVVEVRVGENDHPMADDHFITWVYLETTRGGHLRVLKPGDEPAAGDGSVLFRVPFSEHIVIDSVEQHKFLHNKN